MGAVAIAFRGDRGLKQTGVGLKAEIRNVAIAFRGVMKTKL